MKPPKFQKRNREVKVKRSCHGLGVALLCFAGFGGPQRQVWQLSHANFLYITLLRGSVAIKLNKMKIKSLLFSAVALCFSTTLFSQIPNYVPNNGLVGWWPFNGNANDESGNGNNGTVNGASLTSDRNSISNAAFSFNGISSYITMNLINAINTVNVNGLTLSAWTNMTSLTTPPQSIIFMVDNLNNGFNTGYDQNITKLYGQAGNSGVGAPMRIDALNTVLSNNWYNVVMTCDFNTETSKLYINGVLQTQSSVPVITPVLTKIFIGSAYNQVWYQNGKLDDIGIWNRALSPCEISDLYNAQIGSANTTSSQSESACISYTWNGNTYNQSGQYQFQTTNSLGCDSTATLNLTINQPSSSTQIEAALDSYTWPVNGQTYTQSGQYIDTLTNAAGCDSVITLDLSLSYTGIESLQLNPNKKLVKITDLNGKETPFRKNTVLLFIYEDGTVERVHVTE